MQFELIQNTDTESVAVYKVARVVYNETGAKSLPLVEAFTAMIMNIALAGNVSPVDVICDKQIFMARDNNDVCAASREFQMCVRTVRRAMRGNLPDSVFGATRFHWTCDMPSWAVARGYIADVDGMLFYL